MILNEFFNDAKLNPLASLLAIIITAIGFATTFLILLMFIDDAKTDRFYPGHQRLYRIETRFMLPNGDKIRSAQAPLPLIDALKKDPGIEGVNYAFRLYATIRSEDRLAQRAPVFAVSPGFLAQLNPYRQPPATLEANEIYITPAFNRQYLGLASPQGKTIDLGDKGRFVIKDVLEPRPDSSVAMPAIIAFSPAVMDGYYDKRVDWYHVHMFVFIKTASAAPFDNRLLDKLVGLYAPQLPGAPFTPGEFIHFSAKNIQQMHYDDGYADDLAGGIAKPLLHTLYGAAFFVLLTTAVNFFNVNAVVNAAKRRTLHTKRSLGASDKQLVAEAMAVIVPQFAAICALALLILIGFSAVSPYVLALISHHGAVLPVALFLATMLLIGCVVLASHLLYLYLFVLSAGAGRAQNRHDTTAAYYLNRLTLVTQLLISGVMVYIWAGATAQNHYVMDADFGYHKKNLLTFEPNERLNSPEAMRALQSRLKEATGSGNIALSSWRPFDMSRTVLTVQHARQQAGEQFVTVTALDVDRSFSRVWGLETLGGGENAIAVSEDPAVCHVMVTRSFMALMGLSSYDETLNTTFYAEVGGAKRRLRVLRIVDNFYLGERARQPPPLMLFINERVEKYAAIGFATAAQRDRITSLLSGYGLADMHMQTVDELHADHFKNSLLILNVIRLVASLSLLLMLASAMVIGLSEARRLKQTLLIMEAVGGSVYTSAVFFLRQNVPPLAAALSFSFAIGFVFLRRWLRQYEVITGLTYTYAFAALMLLALAVVAVMAMALLAGGGRMSRPGRR
ncbi:darobactin export ABC transporter permease subunit [Acerihabitans arboris]|uniref:Darobactin export ABC transporter permease subunit n=1 Tax=Acerihabitans arboris TaxID=2691583 RepID=A0A845SG10_9GAMM|nr:darobactin export ABC transporter permease subunit [Acerihabitans arboris]NDL61561.1 darobactin export ABC transporter permease subunit [Acerihabitans arboris]